MNATAKKELGRIVNASKLAAQEKTNFLNSFDVLSPKKQRKLFAILLSSPGRLSDLWNLAKEKLDLIAKFSRSPFLSENQKGQMKKIILEMDETEIAKLKNITPRKSASDKNAAYFNNLQEQSGDLGGELEKILTAAKDAAYKFLDSKMQSAEDNRLESIRKKISG